MIDVREIIALSIYKTDYIYPMLKDAVKCAIYDVIFSRTVLEGKQSARISYTTFALLIGCSTSTVKNAIRELVLDGFVRIVGSHYSRTANEYALNLKIPDTLRPTQPGQRLPYKTVDEVISGKTTEKRYVLTAEGEAVINAIKSGMSDYERKLYEKKAIDELMIEGVEITDEAIDRKITEILLRNFSSEKRNRYVICNE